MNTEKKMERQKSILGRKKKGPSTVPGDFIALGKQSKTNEGETKRPVSPSHLGRKKDGSSSLAGPSLAKKPRFGGTGVGSVGHHLGEGSSSSLSGMPAYEEIAIAAESTELLSAILSAEDDMNEDEKVEGLLCGAVKHLKNNRSKPDQIVYLTLMYLSKHKPSLFISEIVIEAFCGLLKRELALTFKAKGNPLVSILACNVLMNAFADEENWPDNFVKVFVEDSLGERVWVDREDCRCFVENIHTAFGTKLSPRHLLMMTADPSKAETPGGSSPSQMISDEEESSKTGDIGDGETSHSVSSTAVVPRYPFQQQAIETFILDTIRDILNRRQPMDSSSRNLIRMITSACGYGEVRNMAAQRMDMWLQNPKLTRVSQDLLLAVCTNCDKRVGTDGEVIAHLTKMRMKTKPLINHFLLCMRELLSQHTDNLGMILSHTVYNELSTSRNPNNMALLGVAFSHSHGVASKLLAEIFQDLLTNKDDYLRALRMLLREIVRATRLDMNFPALCLGFMQERSEPKFDMDPTLKERYIVSITDLISMAVLLSIAPNVRDAAAALMQGDHKNLELIHVFKRQVAVIQRDAVWWLHIVVPKITELKADIYLHCLKRVLFLESPEHYYNKDNWPPESERGLMLRLASEVPVLEDTLMRVLVIGLFRDLPLSASEALELVDQLICRATHLHEMGFQDVLRLERLEFFNAILNLCAYKHPENIALPDGYVPPNLAITGLMWKAWLILLIITAHNPSVFGETAWQKYPTLQFLMEMAMTNNYTFPPPTAAPDEKKAEEYRVRERQIRQQEIQIIIEFETHLAAAATKITESSSHLIGKLHLNDPPGPARFPPPEISEQLKSLNQSMKLGQMLCRSRKPDFLLQIINRQGTSQSMPWLAELVESSEASLDVLPVQCLCEFLLHTPLDAATDEDADDSFERKSKKHHQLLTRLQELVHSSSTESRTMQEILDYFLQRLSSTQASTRHQAVKGLSRVVAPAESDEQMDVDSETANEESENWLLIHMPSLPLFPEVRDSVCLALRKACQVETNAKRISIYIRFLSENCLHDIQHQTWNEMALDISQLLVERTSVMNAILPQLSTSPTKLSKGQSNILSAFIKLFIEYMKNARTENRDTFSWSNTQDQVLVQWESGLSATMHVLVVHAMINLLTYGKPRDESKHPDNDGYNELMSIWIQENGRMPAAYLLDTSEEALLLPDSLKLRMLRSYEEKLMNAALLEVDPSQLILFVQSFGIPVHSMSLLLAKLDEAITNDAASIMQPGMDREYLMNLVEIQHARGATGGNAFYQLLSQGKEATAKEKEESPEVEETSMPNVWNVNVSGQVMLPHSMDKLARLLDQVMTDTKGVEKGPAKQFQCVLQAVSTDKAKAALVVKTFDHLLNSSKSEAFAEKVFAATYRACPILKVLIAKQRDLHGDLTPVIEKLHAYGKGRKSMLTAILTQFLATASKKCPSGSSCSLRQIDALLSESTKKGQVNTDGLIKGINEMSSQEKVETAIDRTMESLLAGGRLEEGTKIACHFLANKDSADMTNSSAKLLIDWLSLLDPEIIRVNPALQQQLLFARQISADSGGVGKADAAKRVTSQAYLLALLTHQTSWATLNRCLDRLLQPDNIKDLDATAALDFVWACAHIPKIWQGREKKKQQFTETDDVLGLTNTQIVGVVDLLLEEASLAAQSEPNSSSEPIQKAVITKGRVDLLLACVCEDMERVLAVVNHLQEKHQSAASNPLLGECVASLAIHLYLQYPYIQSWLPDNSPLLAQVSGSTQRQSQMDVISFRLINSLGGARPGAKAQGRMRDANIACRKLAAHHPAIFLRQLPLISTLLFGQTEFSTPEMRHTNRFQLFTHILGLLELLQPHMFQPEHTSLPNILDCFFSLMQNHGREKALGSTMHKFVLILQNFMTHSPDKAFPLLGSKMDLLTNLACVHPEMLELKALITSLTMPRQQQDLDKGNGNKALGTDSTELVSSSSGYTMTQLAPLLNKFQKESTEVVIQALQDLDELSKRKVEILSYFQNPLKKLMKSFSEHCRKTTFILVMRCLRHNPRIAESFVACFLECLNHENPDVVTSALKNLAEFCALSQEDASTILQTAFNVSIKRSIDASPYISETLQMLNLHSATAQ